MKSRKFWIIIALLHVVIAVPNATVTKVVVDSADPFFWTMTRAGVAVLIVLPFVLRDIKKLFQRSVFPLATVSAVSMAIAMLTYVFAVKYSQASYVSILALASPIVIMFASLIVFREKLTRRTAAGVTLAAIGAMTLVILPIALAGQSYAFYPLATLFMIVNVISFAIAIVTMRKVDQQTKLPLPLTIWYGALVTAAAAGILFMILGDASMMPIDTAGYWLAAIYTGILIAFIGRIMMIKTLEHIGPALFSAFGYIEIFAAILFPVFVLGEQISITMAIGGILILFGVYVIEHHKHPHHRHYHLWKHH